MEVKINCTSTIETQPSSLYRELVFGCRWSFRQVSLYNKWQYMYMQCVMGITGLDAISEIYLK